MRSLRRSDVGIAAMAVALALRVEPLARPARYRQRRHRRRGARGRVDRRPACGSSLRPAICATKFARIVVSDDQGRYVIPDLPKAKYKVWVRGYGLVDSPKVDGEPGKLLDLSAVAAPSEIAAAQVYPAIYWYSMLKIPDASQFGGKSSIPDKVTQIDWLSTIKNRNCIGCHQLGQLSTRTIPASLGEFKSGEEAWIRRVQSGQSAENMVNPLGNLGGLPFKYFGDWTDQVAKGELPHAKPKRPEGIERNIVVTTWEWGEAEEIPARSDRFGSPQSDGQCLWAALRLTGIFH